MSRRSRLAALAVGALACSALAVAGFAGGGHGGVGPGSAPAAADAGTTGQTASALRVLPATQTPTPSWTPYGAGGERRPNILMITSDDLAVSDLDYMPHVRQLLARQGVTFTDAVAPTPICVPARASLLTGQYAHNHGARTISGPYGGYQAFDERRTLPVALQRAGYDTLFTGKYLNGYGEDGTEHVVPPGWTDWRATVDPSTYGFWNPQINHNGVVTQYHRYTTYLMRDQADTMLEEPSRTQRPWFMWVNYVAPHHGGPIQEEDPANHFTGWAGTLQTTVPAPEDDHRYDDVPLPKRPDMFDVPTGVPADSPSRAHHWTAQQKEALRSVYDQRIEAVQAVDRAVASQIRVLRWTHQLARTIVIFASDNGYATGEHNINGKLIHYDSIMRIPVLMRGPRIPHGTTVGTTLTNPDIATTILAAAGATPLRPQDGVNILPWLRTPTQLRVVPIEGWRVQNGTRRLYFGVRVGPWTYVQLRHGEELYDRATDPYELHSLVHDARYGTVLEQLRELSRADKNCRGSSCPKAFYPA
ncbi:sulfatase [Nocardioides sp. DS6]|uniref:Sulfatase n=1 Tax=Nocardioides eburneus TaxID=3231482 RepID=A0ABV3T1I0_9ACTN